MTTPPPPPPRARLGWVRAATDRVPTRWFAGIGTVLFLTATAAFGGLAAAAEDPAAELEAGDEHRNDQLSLIVDRAVLIDELADAGVEVEPDERVLAIVVTAENVWTQPLWASSTRSVGTALRVEALGDEPPAAVARFDDAVQGPYLQPGVPAPLVVTWAVPARDFADGDELRIVVRDESLFTGGLFTGSEVWTDPVTAAYVTAPLTDVGAGTDAATEDAG